jgi:hypothetical protein
MSVDAGGGHGRTVVTVNDVLDGHAALDIMLSLWQGSGVL